MGKRSNFERNPRDFYPTPKEAVAPLIPHLEILSGVLSFVEPCAGNGALFRHIGLLSRRNVAAKCFDIEPNGLFIEQKDALTLTEDDIQPEGDTAKWINRYKWIITNPPWDRKILHPMIEHFRQLRPTWLLIDADWMFTKQARPYLKYCSKIVNIGRVKWIPDSKYTGKDNCCWYLFHKDECSTEFINEAY
jgi:hypothetical protein